MYLSDFVAKLINDGYSCEYVFLKSFLKFESSDLSMKDFHSVFCEVLVSILGKESAEKYAYIE